ncbi:glycosyltransferase family 2 protein [Chloroflexota bacterium]
MQKYNVCIILPALNEEVTIGKVIDEIPKLALEQEGYQVEVVVVNNNSSDRTSQIAQEHGARVINELARGKGRAVRTALESIKADFVFMLDADYTYPATYIPEMLKILQQDYPVVIGSRLRGQCEKGAISRLNIVGNLLLTLMANILYQTRISDLCTGYWGIRGEIIPKLKLRSDGFQLEAELFAQVAKRRYRLAEVPIYYRRRQTKAKLNQIIDGIKIGWTLISRRF